MRPPVLLSNPVSGQAWEVSAEHGRFCGASSSLCPHSLDPWAGGNGHSHAGRGLSANTSGSCGAERGVSQEQDVAGCRAWGQGPWGRSWEAEAEV